MTAPAAVLLLRARAEGVRSWARKGLLPVWVVPSAGWTLVVPAAGSAAAPPYDDPVALLGGRPVPPRLRPALCLVAEPQRAVVAVQDAPRAAAQRWLVWTAGVGPSRVDGLPHAPLRLVADVVDPDGERGMVVLERLQEALRPDGRGGADVVDDLLRALELPGAGVPIGSVLAQDLPEAVRVDPDERVVERFDAFVEHESRLQAELEEPL
ncbi:MAG TPA: hypothetical protein VF661_13140 [Actinomycetales bacterium]